MSDDLNAGSVLEFRKLDNSVEIDSLILQIKEILREGQSHNVDSFDLENWEWQYKSLPTGDTRIYVCICDHKIVGYYHVPIYKGVVDGQARLFGMVQDVAVSSTMRGRGVFRKLAEFATDDLINSADIDLIYTFPNTKSIHTFIKYNGYKQIYSYDTFVLPVSSSVIIRSKFSFLGIEKLFGFVADKYFDMRAALPPAGFEVSRKDVFDDETSLLFAAFGAKSKYHLDRSKEYLNWRYFEKPNSSHYLFILKGKEKLVAAAVFKLDEILDTKTAVLLDFAYEDELDLARLIHDVRENCFSYFNQEIGMIYTGFCSEGLFKTRSYGFIKVPQRFNPRPLNLLVKTIEEKEETVFKASHWFANLGDWDVL